MTRRQFVSHVSTTTLGASLARKLLAPDIPAEYPIGLDWHSRLEGGESLRVEVAGDEAL